MFEQLDSLLIRYDEVNELLADPTVIADTDRLRELTIEEADLRPKVEKIKRFKEVEEEIEATEVMLDEEADSEILAMAKEELTSLKNEDEALQEEIRLMMIPEDPNDGKNIIMEIRGAAGGDEAQLFAGDLLNMYTKYADKQGWKTCLLYTSDAADE